MSGRLVCWLITHSCPHQVEWIRLAPQHGCAMIRRRLPSSTHSPTLPLRRRPLVPRPAPQTPRRLSRQTAHHTHQHTHATARGHASPAPLAHRPVAHSAAMVRPPIAAFPYCPSLAGSAGILACDGRGEARRRVRPIAIGAPLRPAGASPLHTALYHRTRSPVTRTMRPSAAHRRLAPPPVTSRIRRYGPRGAIGQPIPHPATRHPPPPIRDAPECHSCHS